MKNYLVLKIKLKIAIYYSKLNKKIEKYQKYQKYLKFQKCQKCQN